MAAGINSLIPTGKKCLVIFMELLEETTVILLQKITSEKR